MIVDGHMKGTRLVCDYSEGEIEFEEIGRVNGMQEDANQRFLLLCRSPVFYSPYRTGKDYQNRHHIFW